MTSPHQLAAVHPRYRIERLRAAIEKALLSVYERQERRERLLFPPPETILQTALRDDDASEGAGAGRGVVGRGRPSTVPSRY